MTKSELNNRKLITIILSVLIVLFACAFIIINFIGFPANCDSDMYEDLLISKLMWDSKSFFPGGWVFGNQYFVIATPVVAAFVYGICGNLNLAMALATTIMTVLIILAFVWMIKPFTKTINERLTGVALMLGGIIGTDIVNTVNGQIFYLTVSYYSSYILTLLLGYGLYIRIIRKDKINPLMYIITCLCCFATGMQSIRETAVLVLPLMCMEGLRLLSILIGNKRITIKDMVPSFKIAIPAFLNATGFVLMKLINPPHHNMYGNTSLRPIKDMPQGFINGIKALKDVTGVQYLYNNGIGLSVILGIVAVVFILLVTGAIIIGIRDNKQESNIILSLAIIGIVCELMMGTVMSVNLRSLYYFMWYVMIPIAGITVYQRYQNKESLFIPMIISISLLLNLIFSYGPSVEASLKHTITDEEKICNYLMDNGYKYVYGRWHNAPKIAAMSNGRVIAGNWYEEEYVIYRLLNIQNIYEEEDNSVAAIVLSDDEKEEALNTAKKKGATMTLLCSYGEYSLYKSSIQLMGGEE